MPIKRWLPLEWHAVSDTVYFAALILIAVIADHQGARGASAFTAAVAGSGILLYLISASPLGLFPVLPLRWHSAAEYAAAPLLMLAPPLLYSDCAIVAWGVPLLATFNLLVNAFSDYPETAPACAA